VNPKIITMMDKGIGIHVGAVDVTLSRGNQRILRPRQGRQIILRRAGCRWPGQYRQHRLLVGAAMDCFPETSLSRLPPTRWVTTLGHLWLLSRTPIASLELGELTRLEIQQRWAPPHRLPPAVSLHRQAHPGELSRSVAISVCSGQEAILNDFSLLGVG